MRLLADFDNFRRRVTREKNETYQRATEAAITEFLPVLDRIYLLKRRRKEALDELHAASRQIDCIDFCIHELETRRSEP